jgi:P2 family phage contractile tail tube protein
MIMGKITAQMIPEVINNFKVYGNDGDEYLGVTAEVSLAELSNVVSAITGAGLAGTFDSPVIGHYDSIKQEIPFRIMTSNAVKMMDPMQVLRLNIRGAIQMTDKGTGVSAFTGLRYVVGGRCIKFAPDKLKAGDVMDCTATIEATYILVEADGEKIIELDKVNNIFSVNGKDLLEEVRKYC